MNILHRSLCCSEPLYNSVEFVWCVYCDFHSLHMLYFVSAVCRIVPCNETWLCNTKRSFKNSYHLPDPFCSLVCGFQIFNTLRPRQVAAISQMTLSKAFYWMKKLKFRLKFHWNLFLRIQYINNIPLLVQIMAYRLVGAKPFSEPMMVRLPTHIYVTRLQWIKMHCSSN